MTTTDITEPVKRKKIKKWPFILGIPLLLILIFLGLIGILPGTNNPRDLGVDYSLEDYQRAKAKLEPSLDNLSEPIKNVRLGSDGKMIYDLELTDAEVSALINHDDNDFPLSESQVRFDSDGSIESSGRLHLGSIALPVYLKGQVEIVEENQVDLSLTDFRVGSLPVPAGLRAKGMDFLNSSINEGLQKDSNANLGTVTFSKGKFHFTNELKVE